MQVSLRLKSRPDHRVTKVPRKVRTPKSKVVGNAHPEQSAGLVQQKANRQRKLVRVKRRCKRPPVIAAMQLAM
jgi:hypothetical protein